MNKYLLLRDNKQSGPYTVPELIEKGIKPYDLVWHDGKSISWRYPSEIEELKAYAPAVEEQPFDRFYKKPEATIKTAPVSVEHSAYEPKVIAQTTVEEELPLQKKVYINFPVGNTPERKPPAPQKLVVPEPVREPVYFSDKTNYCQPVERISSNVPKVASNKNHLYYAGAACFILIGFVTVLLINNKNQNDRLKELNIIVKEIENKNAGALTAQTSQVTNTTPAAEHPAPQTSETIVNPELLSSNDYNKSEPAEKEIVPAPEQAAVSKENKPVEIAPGVVYKERPVLRRTDNKAETTTPKEETTEAAPSSSDNIYKLVSVKPNIYKTGVLGGISNLQFELTNNSKRELHKVAIEIKYLGPEKKVVNRQTIYFENISPGGTSTIDVPKSKRGVSIDYTITDIKS
jgi:hypothetical protein